MKRLAAIGALAAFVACGPADAVAPRDVVRFTVPRGATLATVADSLHAQGLVGSARLFRFYAAVSGRSRAVQAGTYDIPPRASVRQVLRILVSGRPALRRLVVQEGLMLPEIAASLAQQLGIPAESVLAAARDDSLRAALSVQRPTLEGYLYPSTYLVRVDADPRDVIRQMVVEFERRWRPEWTDRLQVLGMSRDDIVTLASIIEGEVRHDADRAYVSSVYHNRLQRGMRLQADPTVIYALGQRRRLFERDYQTPSPYNTYLIDGLPPGPVAAPSAASLRAALFPARTPFLYFVARPDGQHVFSRTYAEHLRTIREIRSVPAPGSGATSSGVRR
ncbi:MAG: endolytic transglycosylase MltG [Gemmatimonadales bacterium]|jgi:UPF0755 protein|nr:endolytic transglycosylase MltG [Gemmatimonadales bacterium]